MRISDWSSDVCSSDLLRDVERLTLWNVKVPRGFLGRLEKLWWLDLRGGTGADLSAAMGASRLRYLAVNQVRGLADLSLVSEIRQLQLLSLYGLAKTSEEHTSELQSLMRSPYAVFCLNIKRQLTEHTHAA